jgi:hypothetical protein
MPKVRDSSGTIGTTRLPIFLSFSSVLSMRTKAIVVEISRPRRAFSSASNADSPAPAAARPCDARGRSRRARRGVRAGTHLRAVVGELVERRFVELVVGIGMLKRSRKAFSVCSCPSSSAGG